MRKHFIVSLCRNGILGGGMAADKNAVTYRTGKLTVPAEYRVLEMKYSDIRAVSCGRLFIFPTATLSMSNGEEYKFIVFGRKRFIRLLNEMGVST